MLSLRIFFQTKAAGFRLRKIAASRSALADARTFASREVFLPTHMSPAKIIPFICSCGSKLCEAFCETF